MGQERVREEKQAGADGVSITRRRFLKRAGKVGAGLAALAVAGPVVMAATTSDAEAVSVSSDSSVSSVSSVSGSSKS